MVYIKPDQKVWANHYLQNGNNATKASQKTWPYNKYSTARYKGCMMMKNENVKEYINEISEKNGLDLDGAMSILNNKVKNEPDHQVKALNTWFRVTGNEAPMKSETKTEITEKQLLEEKSDLINQLIRRSFEELN